MVLKERLTPFFSQAKQMKITIFLIIGVISCLELNAQTTTLLAYDANGNRVRKQLVGSSPHPTVTASPEAVNPNQPSTLVASGCPGTVQWQPVNQTGGQIIVNPAATTQYTAQCVVNGCANNGFVKTTVSLIQCNTATITATPSVGAVKYGQPVSLYAFGCTGGTINWSSGQVGTPVSINIYGSSAVFTAICSQGYCPNLGSASIIVGGISGCLTGDVIISKQIGNWNDPNTWICGRVPTINDEVYINHQVSVSSFGYAKSLIKGGGFLVYDNNGTIILP
jgi:hypothetical protein